MSPIDAGRVIADLRELDRRTGGPEGARRVCWGPAWREARDHLTELLAEIGVEPDTDEAGNLFGEFCADQLGKAACRNQQLVRAFYLG